LRKTALTGVRSQPIDRIDGGAAAWVDPYAAESPEEYFARTSEVHFSVRSLLLLKWPRIAEPLEPIDCGGLPPTR
jgi:Mlc titration factor MtfA (ptsG expression regulator)